jgi:hypothetical protein
LFAVISHTGYPVLRKSVTFVPSSNNISEKNNQHKIQQKRTSHEYMKT